MMRTPVKKNGSEARVPVMRNLASTITIGSPKTQVRSTRTFSRATSSSQQIAAILYEKPNSPAPYPNSHRLVDGKENVIPNLNFAERTESTRLIANSLMNPPIETMAGDFSTEFFNWLKKTENESNSAEFARLKKDLCQVVGRFTLECAKKDK